MHTLKTLHGMAKELTEELNKIEGVNVTPDIFNRLARRGKWRWDKAKYDISGRGSEINTPQPIWYENRRDEHGQHIVLFTINEDWLTDFEKGIWEKAVKIWNDAA